MLKSNLLPASKFTYRTIFIYIAAAMLIPLGLLGMDVNVDSLLMVIALTVLLWFWAYKKELVVKYFYWILISVWNLIDIFALENWSLYLPNLYLYSQHTGSLYIRIIGFLALLTFLAVFDDCHSRRSEMRSAAVDDKVITGRLFLLATVAAYCLLFIALIDGLMNGYFASGAASRYEYNMNATGLSQYYYPLLRLAIPVVAVYAQRRGKPSVLLAYIAVFLGYLILTGNRFGALLIVVSLAFISYLFPQQKEPGDIRELSKRAITALCVCACILLAYSLIQGIYERGSLELALENLFDRLFTGQGDVWWGIFAQDPSGSLRLDELGDELQAFNQAGLNQIQFNFGIYKMMHLIAPDSVLQAYANTGARFTASTEASLYYYFGFIGVIAGQIIVAWIASKLTNELIAACRAQNIIAIVCLGFLFNYALGAASMSEFYRLLTLPAIGCYIVLGLVWMPRKPVITAVDAGTHRIGGRYDVL